MKTIKVTNNIEFDSIKTLILNRTNKTEDIKIDGNEIIYGDSTKYVKSLSNDETSDDIFEISSDDEKTFNRFEAFFNGGNEYTTWDTFREKVVDDFFKSHSYLVYSPARPKIDFQKNENRIKEIINYYNPNIYVDSLTVEEEKGSDKKVIYEVAVKFDIKFGGQPVYVINKFYFDEKQKILTPKEHQYFNKLVQDYGVKEKNDNNDYVSTKNENTSNEGNISSEVVNNLYQEIFNVMKTPFKDYLVGNAKKTFDEYAKKYTESDGETYISNYEFECGVPQFRYVAKLVVYRKLFTVKNPLGEVILYGSIGDNNEITLTCAHCHQEIFANNSVNAYFKSDDGEHEIIKQIPYDENGGYLSEENYDNDMARHCYVPTGKCASCKRIICKSNLRECDADDCEEPICIDCKDVRKIIVNYDSDGNSLVYHHECVHFCKQTLTCTPREETKTCECCGITYSKEYFNNSEFCGLCEPIVKIGESASIYKKLFKLHSDLFSLANRSKENTCNENRNYILFKIAKKKEFNFYLIDKNELNKGNYEINIKKLSYKISRGTNK